MKVLIIDDDKNVGYSLQKVLRSAEMESFIAKNINEANGHLQEHSFELILLDICLGNGKNGFSFCKELSNPKTSHIPIIIISALWDYEDKIQGLELGLMTLSVNLLIRENFLQGLTLFAEGLRVSRSFKGSRNLLILET